MDSTSIITEQTYPGFSETKSAQIPAKKDRAVWMSASLSPHAETHSWTEAIKPTEGQKHAMSELLAQESDCCSQVFRQRGKTGGQGTSGATDALTAGGRFVVVLLVGEMLLVAHELFLVELSGVHLPPCSSSPVLHMEKGRLLSIVELAGPWLHLGQNVIVDVVMMVETV